MITSTTRNCPHASCTGLIAGPPAEPQCTVCGYVAAPHHSIWAPRTKLYLAAATFAATYLVPSDRGGPFRTEQENWERGLRCLLGGIARRGRAFRFTEATPATACYDVAVRLSDEWRTAGAQITPALCDVPGPLGLIPPGFLVPEHSNQQQRSA